MITAVLIDFGATLVERISDADAPLTELSPVLFPETRLVLGELKRAGLGVAVVSNTETTDDLGMEAVLTTLGIRAELDVVVTSVSSGSRKPDPGIFLRALGKLDRLASEAVMVGDDS